MLVIDLFIFQEGLREGRKGGESRLTQDVRDPPVEPFDHPIGWGVTRLDQAMVNALGTADLLKGMAPCRLPLPRSAKPVGQFLPVIREHLLDDEGGLLEKTSQECPRNLGRPTRMDFKGDPPGGAINGCEQIAGFGLIRHAWQVLHIDMDKPRIIRLEAFDGCGGPFLDRNQRLQIGDPRAASHLDATPTAIRPGRQKLTGDREEIVQWQEQGRPQRHHHIFLERRQGGLQGVGADVSDQAHPCGLATSESSSGRRQTASPRAVGAATRPESPCGWWGLPWYSYESDHS